MEYLQILPQDIKNEVIKYAKRMKVNDDILEKFCYRFVAGIIDTEEEIKKIIDEFNLVLKEEKLLSKFEIGEYEGHGYAPFLTFDEKDLIADNFLLKFVNYFCKQYSNQVIVIYEFNYFLCKSNSPFRMIEEKSKDIRKVYMVKINLS